MTEILWGAWGLQNVCVYYGVLYADGDELV